MLLEGTEELELRRFMMKSVILRRFIVRSENEP